MIVRLAKEQDRKKWDALFESYCEFGGGEQKSETNYGARAVYDRHATKSNWITYHLNT